MQVDFSKEVFQEHQDATDLASNRNVEKEHTVRASTWGEMKLLVNLFAEVMRMLASSTQHLCGALHV